MLIMHKTVVVALVFVTIAFAKTAWLYSDPGCPHIGAPAVCTNLPVFTCCVDYHTVWCAFMDIRQLTYTFDHCLT